VVQKNQNSVETSTFLSEFIALKAGLRYKLRMMGIFLDVHTNVRVHNMSVVRNTSVPESMFEKEIKRIAYHFVQEGVAAGIVRTVYEPTGSNKADILTKLLPGPATRQIIRTILY
jgi:hypothetical protein